MKSRIERFFSIFIFFLLIIVACNNDDNEELSPVMVSVLSGPDIRLNPSGVAPLTAKVSLTIDMPASMQMRVVGQHGASSDIVREVPTPSTSFDLTILGLYPDFLNQVELTFLDEQGNIIGLETFSIQTDELISDMPEITIDQIDASAITPGFNLVNYFGHDGEFLPQRPFMFDEFGDIRWYLDFSDHPTLSTLFYDNGLNRLENGNFIMGDGRSGFLYEINMLGQVQNTWNLMENGLGFHHHVIEKPNGNLLVTVNDFDKSTVEDVIVEFGRTSGQIVNEWDLNESLDNSRRAWETDLADLNIDWFHANAIEFSPSDNSIIVSGRTQGTVKLTEDNEVIWILAPHLDWGTSGDGFDLNQFLLQPLDAQGEPIADLEVLEGEANHPDFEWAWYQHSPILLPNGNVMIFDNGDNRNYAGPGTYSRAVEYRIDEEHMTIQQVWTYGKERGPETFSRIVSKVNYYPNEDNVLFTPGAANFGGSSYGKAIEIDHSSGSVLFEATITPPIAPFSITFHNVQRTSLYGD
ncbi:MAG: aryl-sulfate sulfotransferase [Bacteroidota bacterium]